ncbi:MAG: DNA translocase FtsK 4TM domain-containing protein, partial [Pseudobdellovibrionaceae bacterium]
MSRLLQKFKQDVLGIMFFGAAFFVALSLGSFNPADPSFNSIGQKLKIANYCGYVGSFLADGLFQLFGLSAWLVALGLFRMAVVSFQGEKVSFKDLKLVWASLLILTLSSLVSVYFPQTRIYQSQIYLGGIIGLGISQALVKAFNEVGVQVILWSAASVLVVFYSEKTIQELMAWPMKLLQASRKLFAQWPRNFFAQQAKARKEKKKSEKRLTPEEAKPSAFVPLKPNLKIEDEEATPLEPIQLEMQDEEDGQIQAQPQR